MTISLDGVLTTGLLGDLRPGMSKADVEALLGPPDATGGTSRRCRQPSCYLYGAVEVWFRQQQPRELTGIYWEAGTQGALRLSPACEVNDWDILPNWTKSQIEGYLTNTGIPFTYQLSPSPVVAASLQLTSGVTFAFNTDETETLWAMTLMRTT